MIVKFENIEDHKPTDNIHLNVINRDYAYYVDDFKYLNTKAYGKKALSEVKRLLEVNLKSLVFLTDNDNVKKYLAELLSKANKSNNELSSWKYLCAFNDVWVEKREYLLYMKNK